MCLGVATSDLGAKKKCPYSHNHGSVENGPIVEETCLVGTHSPLNHGFGRKSKHLLDVTPHPRILEPPGLHFLGSGISINLCLPLLLGGVVDPKRILYYMFVNVYSLLERQFC